MEKLKTRASVVEGGGGNRVPNSEDTRTVFLVQRFVVVSIVRCSSRSGLIFLSLSLSRIVLLVERFCGARS
jgi:hypothetical protein